MYWNLKANMCQARRRYNFSPHCARRTLLGKCEVPRLFHGRSRSHRMILLDRGCRSWQLPQRRSFLGYIVYSLPGRHRRRIQVGKAAGIHMDCRKTHGDNVGTRLHWVRRNSQGCIRCNSATRLY